MPETGEELYSSFLGYPGCSAWVEMPGVSGCPNPKAAANFSRDGSLRAGSCRHGLAENLTELGAFVGEGAAMSGAPTVSRFLLRGTVAQKGVAEATSCCTNHRVVCPKFGGRVTPLN